MAMIIKARIEQWITMKVGTEDLDEAFTEVEHAIHNNNLDVNWGTCEVTDLEVVGQVEEASELEDIAFEERREREVA